MNKIKCNQQERDTRIFTQKNGETESLTISEEEMDDNLNKGLKDAK